MSVDHPLVSVIMAAHIVDDYIDEAISSIINQTYTNIELIIAANGSDCTRVSEYISEIIIRLKTDKIRILTTPIGQLGNALNQCIASSRGSLIARMDSDDVAYPKRIEEQVSFLMKNKLDMVGSQLRLINQSGLEIGFQRYPLERRKINNLLPFFNCFAHNTVLIRREILINARGYCGGFNTEDYDLWLRLRRMNIRWENMNNVHLDYRIHDAASRRRRQSYAEACGYAMREFCYDLNPLYFLAFVTHFIRIFFRARD